MIQIIINNRGIPRPVPSLNKVSKIEIGDIDLNGQSDLVCFTEQGICVLKNVSNASDFLISQEIDNSYPFFSGVLGDLNGDGYPDIIAIRSDSGIVNVYFNDVTSPGRFLSPRLVGSGVVVGKRKYDPLKIVDIDGDGKSDIVCSSGLPNQSLSIFLVRSASPSTGVVCDRIDLSKCDINNSEVGFAIGKFDQDNKVDIVFNGKCNSPVFNPPIAASTSPEILLANTVMSINGYNLESCTGIRFGNQEITSLIADSNKINCVIPSEARVNGAINVIDRISVSSSNGVCVVLKPFHVSPVEYYPLPSVSSLTTSFLDVVDMDADGVPEIVSSIGASHKNDWDLAVVKPQYLKNLQISITSFINRDLDFDGEFSLGDYDSDGLMDIVRYLKGRNNKFLEINFNDLRWRNFYTDNRKTRIQDSSINAFVDFIPGRGDHNLDKFFDIFYLTWKPDSLGIVARLNNPSQPGDFSNVLIKYLEHNGVTPSPTKVVAFNQGNIFTVTEDKVIIFRYGDGGRPKARPIRQAILAPRYFHSCDINNDGKTDFVVIDSDSGVITVGLNINDEDFRTFEMKYSSYNSPGAELNTIVMDFDGDGRVDIGVNEPGVNMKAGVDVYVWKIKQNITQPLDTLLNFIDEYVAVPALSQSAKTKVASGDINGDGIDDLLIAGNSSSIVYPPIINSISSQRSLAGNHLRLSGLELNQVTHVRFLCDGCDSPINLNFVALSDSELSVVLPAEPKSGYISVENLYGVTTVSAKITVLEAPDMFVSVPYDSLILTESNGKFNKPVKRGKRLHPNWINLLEEVIVQGGFQPGASESDLAGGLRVGISHIFQSSPGKWKPIKDSALVRAWVVVRGWDPKKNAGKNWSAIQKTLKNKNFEHEGIARGLDSTGLPGDKKRKKLRGELKILDPKKTSNKLFAELVALKFNIAASQLGKTPVGFGELVYDNNENICDELSILQISRKADSAMTYYSNSIYEGDDHDGINPLYEDLYQAIYQINRAFVGPMDTLSFEVGKSLVLNGVVNLADVPFLKMPEFFRPSILHPTTLITESNEDVEDMDDIETLPTIAKLYQNYPNPFNPTTSIRFRLKENSIVSLKIYNTLGQQVAILLDNQVIDAGNQAVEFDAGKLSSGVYFYRLTVEGISGEPDANRYTEQLKMLLLK